MRRGILALFLVLSFALQSFAAEVQGNPADKTQGKTVKLDDVVVTATKTEMKTSEAPASIDVLTSEDLAIKANADNIFDALKTIPGTTTLSTGGGMGWGDIKIRGFMPSILINGRDSRHFATNYGLDPGLGCSSPVRRGRRRRSPKRTTNPEAPPKPTIPLS